MKHCLLLGLFLLCGLTLAARDIYMVSVGISDYKYINDLTKAENDARTMAALYRTHTVKVKELLGSHATHDSILATLRSFYAAAKEDDIVVFFLQRPWRQGRTLCLRHATRQKPGLLRRTAVGIPPMQVQQQAALHRCLLCGRLA